MPLDYPAVTALLWFVVAIHLAAATLVLLTRTPWCQKLTLLFVVASVPLLGPLYYLLFQRERNER